MIKIGILGYGNLGKGVEAAIAKNEDLELTAVYTRRAPESIQTASGATVKNIADLESGKEDIDVLIICSGSATDLPEQTPKFAALYNVIDSFDTHANIPTHFANVDKAAQQAGKIGIIS
ncbi:MAG: diaminopimelate dehydrogenase, partial [Ruminococcaceae bacterium]|nr:diaminopimelate dehydrogenase [Oscillospiraceae bacterium]